MHTIPFSPRRPNAFFLTRQAGRLAPSATATPHSLSPVGGATRCLIDVGLLVAARAARPSHHRKEAIRPRSIVPPVVEMRIYACKEHPAMPAESGLVRLQEEYEDLKDRMAALDAYVLTAASDGDFTTIELAEYRSRRDGTFIQGEEVGRSIGFMADAVGLAKTLLHAAAVTPWSARQARERAEDRVRVMDTPILPPNVIPFPEPDHGPRAA